MTAFQQRETRRQAKYKQKRWPELPDGKHSGKQYSHILPEGHLEKNYYPPIYDALKVYLEESKISLHSSSLNLKSSQACCFNFLFPWRLNLGGSTGVLASILPDVEQVLDIEFEYTGPDDATEWLGEPPGGGRGQNRTSVDAAIWWRDQAGNHQLTLIEWKYTESSFGDCGGYKSKGNQRKDKCRKLKVDTVVPREDCYVSTGNDGRTSRNYWTLLKESGIAVSDLLGEGCPFRGPWYQLLRLYLLRQYFQQNLRELDSVNVAVVGLNENWCHLLRMPSYMEKFGNDVIDAWNELLVGAPPLRKISVEHLVSYIGKLSPEHEKWLEYIKSRYGV